MPQGGAKSVRVASGVSHRAGCGHARYGWVEPVRGALLAA